MQRDGEESVNGVEVEYQRGMGRNTKEGGIRTQMDAGARC
jgi:hypothetical protein